MLNDGRTCWRPVAPDRSLSKAGSALILKASFRRSPNFRAV